MRRVKAILDLMRVDHGIMLLIAILVGAMISNHSIPHDLVKLTFAFFTALFLEISTFALNDYFDLEIDRRNKRFDRPLVRGDIKPSTAIIIFSIFFPFGIISSLFVNFQCFFIALVTAIFAVAYDIKLKRIKQVGNLYIAYTMAIPFLFGAVSVSEDIPLVIWTLAFIAFLAGFGREIMKDVIDIKGDRMQGVKSIPMYIGEKNSYRLASIFYTSAILSSFVPFFILNGTSYYWNPIYLTLVIATDIIFLIISINLIRGENPPVRWYRKLTLFAMIFGLIAFLGGAFIEIRI